MLRGLWLKFDRDWGWNLARILAFACLQMLFAVLGLELIVIALVLRLLNDPTEQQSVNQVIRFLPDHNITTSAITSFERSLETAPVLLLLLGLPIVLWEGSRFFVVLESALCVIFRRQQRRFVHQNRIAMTLLLLFALLLPIIVLSATVLPHFGVSSQSHGQLSGLARMSADPTIATLGLAAGLAANFALLLIAYMWVTPGGVSFRAAWPGALLGAVLSQLYLLIFPYYTRNVLHPDHFGTVAGFVLVILVFFFAYSLFIIVGAELTAWHEGYRAALRDIPTTLMLAHPTLPVKDVEPAALPVTQTVVQPMPDMPAFPLLPEQSRNAS